MPKSDRLLNLDPFAKARERREREAMPTADWSTGQPEPANQSTTGANQSTGQPVNQLTTESVEQHYPSRKNRTLLGVRLPTHKLEKYKLYAHLTKEDLQDLVEYGLDWATGQLANQSTGQPANQSTANHDMMTDEVLKDDVAIFYQKVTGNRWRKEDQDALKEVSQFAPHIIKAGIALSKMRAKVKINSFKYCHGAIHEAAQGNASEDYLQYLVWKLKR